ncbi:hypothetical protein DUNSADRAFT_8548 [Dunaliella salina]|uniref:Encoded protein n=1 Tax=Dunaliella salina TaxID=3046 RepID=A0ABQ7GJ83_DUNSA|nr:hypothetical protein DUNSADRAFT_8548 [Dunaliella salina]|eukprot:KAF5834666.1 hypothetical protein DUNSADRAFT_8548 [Dunaliella salina]
MPRGVQLLAHPLPLPGASSFWRSLPMTYECTFMLPHSRGAAHQVSIRVQKGPSQTGSTLQDWMVEHGLEAPRTRTHHAAPSSAGVCNTCAVVVVVKECVFGSAAFQDVCNRGGGCKKSVFGSAGAPFTRTHCASFSSAWLG